MMTVFCVYNCYMHCFKGYYFTGLFIHSQLPNSQRETEAWCNTNCLMSSSRPEQKQGLHLQHFTLSSKLIYNLGITRRKLVCCLSSTVRWHNTCLLLLTPLFSWLVVALVPAEKHNIRFVKSHCMRRHCDGKCRITVSLQAPTAGKAGKDVGCSRANTRSFNNDKGNTEQEHQELYFSQQQSFLLGLL